MREQEHVEGGAIAGLKYPEAPEGGLLISHEAMCDPVIAAERARGRKVVRVDIPHLVWVLGPEEPTD